MNIFSFIYDSRRLQITIGTQTVTINALQVLTLAIKNIISGTLVIGDKPIAAFSGSICGYVQGDDACDYVMVS
jgi:hypothetical protein